MERHQREWKKCLNPDSNRYIYIYIYIYIKRFEGEAKEYKTNRRTPLLQDMKQLLDNVSPSTFQECTLGKNSKNHKTKTNYTTNQNTNSGTSPVKGA